MKIQDAIDAVEVKIEELKTEMGIAEPIAPIEEIPK